MMIKLTIFVRQILFISAVLALVDRAAFCHCSSPCSSPCLDLNFIFFASREIN
jgi:hypothetical protein